MKNVWKYIAGIISLSFAVWCFFFGFWLSSYIGIFGLLSILIGIIFIYLLEEILKDTPLADKVVKLFGYEEKEN